MKVLKFYSKTCGPCKVLEKNLQEANITHESIDIQSIENENIIDKYEIRTIPTLILIDDEGNILKRNVGILNAQELNTFCNEV